MTGASLLPAEAAGHLDRGEVEAAGVCLVRWGRDRARSRPGEAAAWARRLLAAFDRREAIGPFALWAAGAVGHLTGHTASARSHLEAAARSFAARRRPDLADRVRIALIDVYGEALDLPRARRLARSLEPRFVRRGDRARAAAVLANLACAEDAGDNVLRATELWRRARRRLEQPVPRLLVEANLANAAATVGAYGDACQSHRAVAERARGLGLDGLALQAELNLAEAELALGRVDAAFDRWLRVEAEARRVGNPLLEQLAVLELAQAEVAMAATEVARRRLLGSLPALDELGLDLEKARAHRLLAVIELTSERPDPAVLATAEAALSGPSFAAQRDLLAADRIQLDPTADPASARRAARRLARRGNRHRARVALAWVAQRLADRGRPGAALRAAREVLDQAQASPWARMIAHHVCARCLPEGSPAGWRHLELAVREADRLLGRLATGADRGAFLSSYGDLFLDLIWRLVSRNRPRDRRRCLDLIHRLKSGWLLDELSRRADRGTDPLVHRWQELRRQLAAVLEAAEGEGEPRLRHTGVAVHRRIRTLEAELETVETDLARTRPTFARSVLPRRPSPLAERLPHGHLCIDYLVGRDDLLLCVAESGSIRLHNLTGVAREVADLVASIRFQIDLHPRAGQRFAAQRRASLENRLGRLGEILLAPLAGRAWDMLWLAPHDGLYHLPWAALGLPDGGVLVDRGPFTLVPDSAAVGVEREGGLPDPARVAIAGAGSAELPLVTEEITALARLLPEAETHTSLDRRSLLDLLARCDAVHVAGHALFLDGFPSASGLRLDDGYLTVHDLAATPLSARLMTFGVCSGVRLAERDGHRYEGFLRALLGGGVRTVVGAVARVPDTLACGFDTAFYQELLRSGDTVKAHAAAVTRIRDSDPHPASWGVFHHYGDATSWRTP